MGKPRNQILKGQAVFIENGKVAGIGPQKEMLAQHPQAEKLDAPDVLVMPGNICAHTHFYGAFYGQSGLAIPGAAPKGFLRDPTKTMVAFNSTYPGRCTSFRISHVD